MNDQRPTRWPCSADSSRNAGSPGASARSFRNADTGVSQSSTKLCRERDQAVPVGERARRCRLGSTARPSARSAGAVRLRSSRPSPRRRSVRRAPGGLGATAIEHPLGVGERAFPTAQQHEQVVEHVGRLFVDALLGLLTGGARDLLGLLHHLLADPGRIVEQLDRVGALWALARALGAAFARASAASRYGAPGSSSPR